MGLLRGKIRWTIPGAGTAYTVLHFGTMDASTPTTADAVNAVTKMKTFCDNISAALPNVVKLDVMPECEEIVATTGTMLGVYNGGTTPQVSGTAAAAAGWAAAAGGVISWSTGGVRNGRRVRGRTFVVPLSNEVWDIDGTIKSVPMGTLNTAATNLRAAGTDVELVVYARPSAPGASDGAQFQVLSHRVPDMSAILRSRRS